MGHVLLLTRHESDLKDNQYWLGLLSHTLSESVPGKNLGCVADHSTGIERFHTHTK